MSSVSVIIPARNAASTIGWVLDGLAGQDFEGEWDLIVVDDGCTDATLDLVRGSPLTVRVVQTGNPGGPACARNAGVASTAAEVLAFLDADCRPAPGWLRHGVDASTHAELVQGAVLPDPEQRLGPFDRTLWVTGPSALYESANLFVRRELFVSLGGFESWLGPVTGKELGEDVWFGWRARRAAARTGFSELALAHHAVFPRQAGAYVAERARLRFFPALARRVPELREHFFYRRWFLNRRSAAFDLALAAALLALGARQPLTGLAAVPYGREVAASVRRGGGGRDGVRVALADLAADAVSCAALAGGSARSRTLLL